MITPETSRDGHRATWDALRADGAPGEWSFEALTMLARGEEVPVGVRVTRIGGESPHFVLLVRDLSGREPTEQAQRDFNDALQTKVSKGVWSQGGCTSWYLDSQGKNRTIWPGFTFRYWWRTRSIEPEDFTFATSA